MLSLLFAFALVAQDVPFSAADVRAVTTLILNDLAPVDGRIGARPVTGRPLVIDEAEAATVFQRLTHAASSTPLASARAVIKMNSDRAIRCNARGDDCEVVNDGLFVRITEAAFMPVTGELRVQCSLAWSNVRYDGRHRIDSFNMDIVLKRDGHGWKIVRRENAVTQ